MKTSMIAPCGINCATCLTFLRPQNRCPGCLAPGAEKPQHCLQCTILHCRERNGKIRCHSCPTFPCNRLKQLDKRYRTRYHTSLIGNLNAIKTDGIRAFLRAEKIRWLCPACGKTLCVHRDFCLFCGSPKPSGGSPS